MRPRLLLALALPLALALLLPACDKGGGSEGSGQATTPQPRPPQPPPQPEANCPGECRTLLAGLNEFPRLAVWSVGYGDTDYVQVKNLSGDAVNFDGWQAVTGDASAPMPDGITLEQGSLLVIYLGQSGTNTNQNVYLPSLSLGPLGEFALFAGTDFQDADAIRLYVRWGADPGPDEQTHMSQAAEAGYWHRRGYVPLCDEYSRFGAVGDNMLPRGFWSMADSCFPTMAGGRSSGGSGGFPGR